METRKEVIQRVLQAFVGINGEEDVIDTVLEDYDIEILAQAIDEALERK